MIGVIFLDLKRAFEVIDRTVLLKKLNGYGIKGMVYKWFESYLEGRSQRVKFGVVLSNPIAVRLEVPQGSVLGTILFLIFINDIVQVIGKECEIRLFADDAVIYTEGYSSLEINEMLNRQIQKVEVWLTPSRILTSLTRDEDFGPNMNITSQTREQIVGPNMNISSQNREQIVGPT